MEQKWFSGYGMVDYISPADIGGDDWIVSEPQAYDQYGQKFTILFRRGDYRYTKL